MTAIGWLQIAILFGLVGVCVKPLGAFMARVFSGERTFLSPVVAPVERAFCRASGIRPEAEQGWLGYTLAMLAFNAVGFLILYALLRLQGLLPLNPQGFSAVAPDLAFNTAISFVTNTNWQSYGGETTMSHFIQMAGSHGAELPVGRDRHRAGHRRHARLRAHRRMKTLGNFWVDLTRATLYVLLPLSIVVALAFVALGVPQTLAGSVDATTLEGAKQTIALGPVAARRRSSSSAPMAAASSTPIPRIRSRIRPRSPTMLSIWAMLVISAALPFTFGRMVGDTRQGWALLAAMFAILLIAGVGVVYWAETAGNPLLDRARPRSRRRQHGRQGGPLRPGHVGALRRGHHRPVLRRRQRHARLAHAARRPRADVPDPARRNPAGRRRLRPLRHAGHRDPHGVRRRPDGRPHAGISRQEDRGARDEARHAGGADPAARDPRLHRASPRMLPGGARQSSPMPARTA